MNRREMNRRRTTFAVAFSVFAWASLFGCAPSAAEAAMSDTLCGTVSGIAAPSLGAFRRMCPPNDEVPGWQDGSAAEVIGGNVRLYYSYWREDPGWYVSAERAAWFASCVASEFTIADQIACLTTPGRGIADCQQEWYDHCLPLCLADASCPQPVRGSPKSNPNPDRWTVYETEYDGAAWSDPVPTPGVAATLPIGPTLPDAHNASFTPLAVAGVPIASLFTRWGDVWATVPEGAGWAIPGRLGGVNTACREDEGSFAYDASIDTAYVYFTSDRDLSGDWRDLSDCDGTLRVWSVPFINGAAVTPDLDVVDFGGIESEHVSQPWVPWDLAEAWFSAKGQDCGAITCVYRVDGDGHGAWSGLEKVIEATPPWLAADGDAVAVGECNPVDVPGEGRWVFCTAWLHHPNPAPGQQVREFVLVAAPDL